MERLTKLSKTGDGYVSAIGAGRGSWGRIINRLALCENLSESGRLAVLPCKVGDDIWWIDDIDDDDEPRVKCDKGGVKGIVITEDGFMILDRHNDLNLIGTQFCYLTKEDAERALETMREF